MPENVRLLVTRRVIQTIILLSTRGYTLRQLSEKHKVCTKTIRRDLRCVEDLGIPLYQELIYDDDAANEHIAGSQSTMYKIDRHWMKRFI